MNALESLGCRLATLLCALAFPVLALAQTAARPRQIPPGGVSSAWPLGLIVALIVVVALLGAYVAHRRRDSGAAATPRHR